MHPTSSVVLALSLALTLSLAPPARAVVVATGDGSGNTTAPTDDPGFDHIGTVNGASAIYIANQWVLTAYHVAGSQPASVNFGGINYATESGTWQRLTNNNDPNMSDTTDIVMFRLADDLGLNDLTISSSVPGINSDLVMIGYGLDRETGTTYWNEDATGAWVETGPPPPRVDHTGFETTSTHTVRWGENQVAGTGLNLSIGFGNVESFWTTFDDPGLAEEAQAVVGDSGGAVFHDNGGAWELAGMMDAVGTLEGQPSDTAVFDDRTYAADLSFYRDQINSIIAIPEPSAAALALLSTLALLRRRRIGRTSPPISC